MLQRVQESGRQVCAAMSISIEDADDLAMVIGTISLMKAAASQARHGQRSMVPVLKDEGICQGICEHMQHCPAPLGFSCQSCNEDLALVTDAKL